MEKVRKRILLVGGGHAHVAVLADWIDNGLPCANAVLVTPAARLRYSGMVPGWIAGQYDMQTGTVDLAALAERAGVQLVLAHSMGIDPDARRVFTDNAGTLVFDVASIDTGGVGRARAKLGDDPRLFDVRPIDGFVEKIAHAPSPGHIAVIGGGAGGADLAFAFRNYRDAPKPPKVTFIVGKSGLLSGLSTPVRRKVARELEKQQITVISSAATIEGGALMVDGRSIEPVDRIVAAIGSAAPAWPRESGLVCDERGFIAVDQYQRCVGHPHIYAVGDIAARQDRDLPHSGVHAVFAGPVIAANLRSAVSDETPARAYRPRWTNLYLISTGNGSAIASYGPISAQGRWVATLKHWIDVRWIEKYAALAK